MGMEGAGHAAKLADSRRSPLQAQAQAGTCSLIVAISCLATSGLSHLQGNNEGAGHGMQ